MKEQELAPLTTWLIEPMPRDVASAIERLRRADNVQHVAVMPDVHLGRDVCVGIAVATSRLVYPAGVGGDIGCGMLAVAFDCEGSALAKAEVAGGVLREIGLAVPSLRKHRASTAGYPQELEPDDLSDPKLRALARKEGVLQLGTLGSGNHFIELQADEEDRLWLMIHSGSRCIGPAVRDLHLSRATRMRGGLNALDASLDAGRAYLHDMQWARTYARLNRRAMAAAVVEVLHRALNAHVDEQSLIECDHNHVVLEELRGRAVLVHRKGAMPAHCGGTGVVPGSMGTLSFHVEGRGCELSLCSSAHGAGRVLSRDQARRNFVQQDVLEQMAGVWFDHRAAGALRDEAPGAYKDVRAVMRAQRELVRIVRTLRPVLVYKGIK